MLSLKRNFKISAPVRNRKVFGSFNARLQQLLAINFHRKLFVIMFLVILSDFVIEKVLLIPKRFRAAHVFQKEMRKSRSYNITFFGSQFYLWLTAVIYNKGASHGFVLLCWAVRYKVKLKSNLINLNNKLDKGLITLVDGHNLNVYKRLGINFSIISLIISCFGDT